MRVAAALWFLLATCSGQRGGLPDQNRGDSLPSDAPTTITTRVNLVMVPVVVRDRQGKAVGDLTRRDFQLFDKGKLQTISHFSAERNLSRTPNAAIAPRAAETRPEAGLKAKPNEVEAIPTRFIAYLIDDMHLEPREFTDAREAARKHMRNSLQPGDRAAVFTTSGKVMLDFTHDLALIDQTLLRITPQPQASPVRECSNGTVTYFEADLMLNQNDKEAWDLALALCAGVAPSSGNAASASPVGKAPSGGSSGAQPPPPPEAISAARSAATRAFTQGDINMKITFSTLASIIRRLALMPGQRLIVLVSPGFYISGDFRQQESELMDRAIRSSVTISTVDAGGLYAPTPGPDVSDPTRVGGGEVARIWFDLEQKRALYRYSSLGEFADATGGTWFHNNNDLVTGLNQVAAAPEYYYVLGFTPTDLKLDGKFHELKVVVKAKDVTSQARHGYFASKGALDPVEQAKAELREEFLSRDEIMEIPVTVRTEFQKTKPDAARLTVAARIDVKGLRFRKSDGKNLDTITILIGLFDPDGKLVLNAAKNLDLAFKDATLKAGKADAVEVKSSFDVPAGKYVARLVLRDSEGQMMGARNSVVEIR
jgi:VWFA-related protein